jgi:hypothetical protein
MLYKSDLIFFTTPQIPDIIPELTILGIGFSCLFNRIYLVFKVILIGILLFLVFKVILGKVR